MSTFICQDQHEIDATINDMMMKYALWITECSISCKR